MPRKMTPVLFLFAALLMVTGSLGAQSAQNTPPPPAQQAPPAPQTTSAKETPPAKAKVEPKKTKKVWTDENIGALAGKSNVSVVGQESGSSNAGSDGASVTAGPHSEKGGPVSQDKDPQYYRQQLAPLRSEINHIDARIEHLRHPDTSGKTGGAINLNQRYILNSPEEQIQILEKRKKEVQAKIDAIEDEARRNGISPGDLR